MPTPKLVLPLDVAVEMHTKLSMAFRLLSDVHGDLRFMRGMVPRPGAEVHPFTKQVEDAMMAAATVADEMRTYRQPARKTPARKVRRKP